jgi:aspartokinase-like uncharacterized kinase
MSLSPIWVVKLGGSLFAGQYLRPWLDVLATHGRGCLVIVPGGGPFADQVRAAQKRWCFDDAIAHRMAMLGMAQYGLMLAGLQSELMPAVDEAEIGSGLRANKIPVWVPDGVRSLEVPRDWSATSDSLAAALAARLRVKRLVLVKSIRLAAERISARELARQGVIDQTFPRLFTKARYACRVLAAADYATLPAALHSAATGGTTLTP